MIVLVVCLKVLHRYVASSSPSLKIGGKPLAISDA